MFCPECGAKIEDDSKFCTKCGTDMAKFKPTELSEVSENILKCPNCEKIFAIDSYIYTKYNKCPHCNYNFETKTIEDDHKMESVESKEDSVDESNKLGNISNETSEKVEESSAIVENSNEVSQNEIKKDNRNVKTIASPVENNPNQRIVKKSSIEKMDTNKLKKIAIAVVAVILICAIVIVVHDYSLEPTKFAVDNPNIQNNDSYSVKLTTEDGKPLSNKEVTMHVEGSGLLLTRDNKTFTNNKGVATFRVEHLMSDYVYAPTEHEDVATFKFAGDDKYHSSEVKVNLHVTDRVMYDAFSSFYN